MPRFLDGALAPKESPVPLPALMWFVPTIVATSAVISSVQLNTGAQMPALAFGTYRLGGDELKSALTTAIAAGYRHIDTSAGYEVCCTAIELCRQRSAPKDLLSPVLHIE